MATVSPDHILRDLAGLWTETAREGRGEAGEGVLRACALTLIILADEAGDLPGVEASLADLMPQHPARAILVRLRDSADARFDARVYAQCWLPFGGRRQICSERIDISGGYESLGGLPVFLLPLFVPDLPSVLWLRSARAATASYVRELGAMASKTILDSAPIAAPHQTLAKLDELSGGGLVVGDLAWTKLTQFRAVVWRAFESRERLDELQRVSAVRVICGGERPDTTAWYLGAWVLNSLESAGLHADLNVTRSPASAAGALRLEMDGGGFSAAVELADARLRVELGSHSNCTSLPQPTESDLMREELGVVQRDEIFERALATAARLANSAAK